MVWFNSQHCAVQVGDAPDVTWAQAPANIALIKYMGKVGSAGNKPHNPSLSLTLMHHQVRVELRPNEVWSWQPLVGFGEVPDLPEVAIQRFIKHAQYVANAVGLSQPMAISSAGNFPMSCGLASSAASFAALTAAIAYAAPSQSRTKSLVALATLSQHGSGSSCRSWLQPWVVWDEEVASLSTVWPSCLHRVVVVADQVKGVSSSQAHQRVPSSALFEGRLSRAKARLSTAKDCLSCGDWSQLYQLCWHEFWDMHALFHTANPAFSYMVPASLAVLNQVQQYWQKFEDGPLVTMDAGANVHLIYRADQVQLRQHFDDLFAQFYRLV